MNSRKVYVPGKIFPDIRVGMREILTEDPETPVVTVYDTSGPYSDVDAKLDVTKGIERFRESWIMERGDAELDARRKEMESRGAKAWKPETRNRVVSKALQAYAAMASSADKGAVRDLSLIGVK